MIEATDIRIDALIADIDRPSYIMNCPISGYVEIVNGMMVGNVPQTRRSEKIKALNDVI
jgi:hypothetical protein